MIYLLAFFLPGIALMVRGRVLLGIAIFLLQGTLIGWPVAVIIAILIIHEQNVKRDMHRLYSKPTR